MPNRSEKDVISETRMTGEGLVKNEVESVRGAIGLGAGGGGYRLQCHEK